MGIQVTDSIILHGILKRQALFYRKLGIRRFILTVHVIYHRIDALCVSIKRTTGFNTLENK